MKPTREQIEQATGKELTGMIAAMFSWKSTGKGWRDSEGKPRGTAPPWAYVITHALRLLDWVETHGVAWKIETYPQSGGPWPYIQAPGDGMWYDTNRQGQLPEKICRVVLLWWIEQPEEQP